MQLDVHLIPTLFSPSLISERSVVVIDILRATSVIVRALSQGALEIIPVAKVEEALEMAKKFPQGTTLLGGERGSRKIEGFDLGNSPGEYGMERVRGKRLILTTTNGTKAFHSVSGGRVVMAGSFFNIGAVVGRCLDLGRDLLIYPSGDEGRFSLEDTVCGGLMIDRILRERKGHVTLTDAGQSALLLYQRFEENLIGAFRLSNHGRDLIDRGFEEDLACCARVDITNIVPIFREGAIRIGEER